MPRLLHTCLIALLLVLGPLRSIAPCWTSDGCAGDACAPAAEESADADCSGCCGSPSHGEDDAPEDDRKDDQRTAPGGDDRLCPCCELPLVYVTVPTPAPVVEHAAWAEEPPAAPLEGTHPAPNVPPPIEGRA